MQLQTDKLGKVSVTVEEDYWSINKDYDKLTIVEKEGDFGTFVSRKPVPAGTPLTNRTYWIPFSSLKEEIVLAFNRFIALWTQNLEDTEARLQRQIDANDEDIAEIRSNHDKDVHNLYDAIASIIIGGVALKQEFGTDEQSTVFGISQKVLTEAIGNVHTDDNENFIPLQEQIDAIVSDKATVSLSSSKTAIFVGETTSFTLTATSNTDTATKGSTPGIQIYRENVAISGGSAASGKTKTVTISETPDTNTTIHYSADFMIAGNKRSTTRNVSAVYPIYYGGADVYTSLIDNNHRASARTSVNGTYNINITEETYIFFIVPVSIGAINSATMGGFDFSLEEPTTVQINNVDYRVYRTPQKQEVSSYAVELK